MDDIDKLLDNIELLLQKIPDDNQYRDELYQKYYNYRKSFETNPFDINLHYFLPKFLEDLKNFVYNFGRAPIGEDKQIPVMFPEEVCKDDKSNLNEYIDILSASLDDIDMNANAETIEAVTEHVQNEYYSIKYRKQELDQKICKALFKLMYIYIKNGNDEQAEITAEKFDIDMRIYMINHLKGIMRNFKNEGKEDEAERVWRSIYNLEPNMEKDMKFWYYIYDLDFPNARITKIENSNLLITGEDNSILNEKNTLTKMSAEEQKEYLKATRLSICRISNSNGFCSYSSLKNAIDKIEDGSPYIKSDVFLIFEEGIKVATLSLKNEYDKYLSFKRPLRGMENIKSYLTRVYIPSTINVIAAKCFMDTPNLNDVSLVQTNLAVIMYSAFANSGISYIDFSKSLSIIEPYAFYMCKNLERLDLSMTKVKVISTGCFAYSAIKSIKLPSSLEKIEDYSFDGVMLAETLDLSNCRNLKYISSNAFFGAFIKRIKLPPLMIRPAYINRLRSQLRTTSSQGVILLNDKDEVINF